MKCSKCKNKNKYYSNYCIKCGNGFTKEEQKKAKEKTFFGFIDLIEKWYNRLTLKVITDTVAFKTITLIIVILIGIFFLITMNNQVRVLESDNYNLKYNQNSNEYYLILENKNQVILDLFIPNRCSSIVIKHLDGNNLELDKKRYKTKDKIILNTNQDDYYEFIAKYKNAKEDTFKLFVYDMNDIEISEVSK